MKTFADLKAKYPRLIPLRFGFECHEGWLKILDDYFAVVDHELPKDAVYELRQVKEKLGSLRIYDHSAATDDNRAICDAHSFAEARSYYTCEYCGKPGVWSNRRGYLTTVCEDHAVRDGYRATPCNPDEAYVFRDQEGIWRRYDPVIDAFVATEVPEWAR